MPAASRRLAAGALTAIATIRAAMRRQRFDSQRVTAWTPHREVVDGRKAARLRSNYAFAAAGLSMGTPTTEPYSVHEPS